MFAGQTGELRFLGTGLFDGVQFSTVPIPEPGAEVLLRSGVLGCGWWLRQRRRANASVTRRAG